MFAVIKTGGKQYQVSPGDILQIEKIVGNPGDPILFESVLMINEDDKVTIGTPLVKGASVAAKLIEQTRAKKIIVFKKRRRKGFRTKNGHRQHLTTVRIDEISKDGKLPKAVGKASN